MSENENLSSEREGTATTEANTKGIDPHRLEAFSDGIMAVIITLMAFDLKPPLSERWSALQHRLPLLLVYILSFVVIGIYWNNHHHLFRATKRISTAVMWSNLVLLFWLSLVPFGAEWVGKAHDSLFPAATYGIIFLGAAISYFILVRAILRANYDDPQLVGAIGYDIKGVLSAVITVMGVGLAFVSPYLAYACYASVSAMWFIPSRRLTRRVN
jgi:uncharacterized membrane protein